MTKEEILGKIKNSAMPVLERNDVECAGIFGSYARGEAKETSDIDFLVRFKKTKSIFDLVRIESELMDKDKLYISHILESIEKIEKFVAGHGKMLSARVTSQFTIILKLILRSSSGQ